MLPSGCEEEHVTVSRTRRSSSDLEYQVFNVEDSNVTNIDPMDQRIEGLEVALLRTHMMMKRLRRRMNRFYGTFETISTKLEAKDSASVCIDYTGSIVEDGEVWIHQDSTSCASCICKVRQCVFVIKNYLFNIFVLFSESPNTLQKN